MKKIRTNIRKLSERQRAKSSRRHDWVEAGAKRFSNEKTKGMIEYNDS